MSAHMFAAIDCGSYELECKSFELSRKNGIREVDSVRQTIDLGSDTYNTGKIGYDHVRQVEQCLIGFRRIMDNYGVENYRAYGTSAIREMMNASIVLSQWERASGIHIDVLSNSEQRFLDYKSVASRGQNFNKVIDKGTAIVDIGGGSIQISLFDQDRLVTTQNLKLGVLRLYEQIRRIDPRSSQFDRLVEELVNAQLKTFDKLYLKEREIRNIIIVDDYISMATRSRNLQNDLMKEETGFVSAEDFYTFVERFHSSDAQAIARYLGMPNDNIGLLHISAVMMKAIAKTMKAEMLWAPGVCLCDGIAYEYAEAHGYLKLAHDFEQDIIACADGIRRRYKGSKERADYLQKACTKIFDTTKKVHGFGQRERLLLQISAILHDCGEFISMVDLPECSYSIIMANEIIGLSHKEREIVANVVKYNHEPFEYYESQETVTDLSANTWLVIAVLTSILRVADGLDRSHSQKFSNMTASLKEDRLLIGISGGEDITLEKGLFQNRASFFEEVMGITPVIKVR